MLILGEKIFTVNRLVIIALIVAGLILPLHAKSVTDIGGASMSTAFTPGGIGSTLTITEDNGYPPVDNIGGTTIFVKFSDGSTQQFPNGDFILSGVTLTNDLSDNEMAIGLFAGGNIVIRDQQDNDLFSAGIVQLGLVETGYKELTGSGLFANAVTSVPGAAPLPAGGTIDNITFNLSIDIDSFALPFTALSSMDFLPEPASLLTLAAAVPLLCRKRKNP